MEKPSSSSGEPPAITSFIIRFIYEEPDLTLDPTRPGKYPYRGSIRHIQTDEEVTFTRWEDAMAFISRFVPME